MSPSMKSTVERANPKIKKTQRHQKVKVAPQEKGREEHADKDDHSLATHKHSNIEQKMAHSASLRRKTQLTVIDEAFAPQDFEAVYDSEEEEAEETNNDGSTADGDTKPRGSIPSAVMRNVRRRSAMIFSHESYKEQRRLDHELEFVRDKLTDSYHLEGDNILLHGYLHIQIIRASGLRNADWLRALTNPLQCKWKAHEVSDPYVTVHAGAARLLKTRVIMDSLDPEWNQDFYVPVCHYVKELEFRVKDWDTMGSDLLGKSKLSVGELIAFGEDDDLEDLTHEEESLSMHHKPRFRRRGVHKTVFLDGKPHHGSFEYVVEFIPKDLLHSPPNNRGILTKKSNISMVVPGVYFPLRQNNRVRFYINAADRGSAPSVQYGPADNRKIWKPRRFFRDVYDAFCHAKHMIYVVGWSVDYTTSLLRGKEQTEGLNKDRKGEPYSPFIGELLNQKANEGVVVNMLVWDDNTSNAINRIGVVATRDEQLRDYFRDSKVNLRLVPMAAGDANMLKQLRNAVYYTHHQKCVICDTPQKELVAFVGGIDLTYGRFDDGTYPLFRTLNTEHKNDFHQACYDVTKTTGPRQPWHDIHSRVKGDGTLDLLKNFEERWIGQGGLVSDLVRVDTKGISTHPTGDVDEEEDDTWNTQLFRSIDTRTAKMETTDFKPTTFEETKGVEFDESKKVKTGKRKTLLRHLLKTGPERAHHFIENDQASQTDITVARPLDYKRDLQIDRSVHKALVHHIRNAQHTIYIESQYFLSSSFQWDEGRTSKCCNMVAAEITMKICAKIESGERFAAYILVPMWPEGLSDSSSVQDILYLQSVTMKSMYRRIRESIDRRMAKLVRDSPEAAKRFADIKPTDYLNFYCLANREESNEHEIAPGMGLLTQTRRSLVYTHSKMTIVDDAIVICGSANINQRSLDGNRDSELLMGSWQPQHIATRDGVAEGDVHGFRLHCWAHLTGTMEDIFRRPQSLECVRRLNVLAAQNWQLFTQDKVVEMPSSLIPYPIKVTRDGDIVPATMNGKFPDCPGNILGSNKPSLPKFLTT